MTPRTIAAHIRYAWELAMGAILYHLPIFKRNRNFYLRLWSSENKGSIASAMLAYWFKYHYYSEENPDTREWLKTGLMGGQTGKEWAEFYNRQKLEFSPYHPLLATLNQDLTASEPSLAIQIGSSSGREIAWLAKQQPNHQFVGTDISPEIVDFASRHYQSDNARFEVCPVEQISRLLQQDRQRTILFSSGSLQYVQPEHLDAFFGTLSSLYKTRDARLLRIYLQEPADNTKGNPTDLKGSRWRGNFSYTHDYRFYAEKWNFTTEKCELLYRPGIRTTVGHYFFIGRLS